VSTEPTKRGGRKQGIGKGKKEERKIKPVPLEKGEELAFQVGREKGLLENSTPTPLLQGVTIPTSSRDS